MVFKKRQGHDHQLLLLSMGYRALLVLYRYRTNQHTTKSALMYASKMKLFETRIDANKSWCANST